ncbi:MAG: alpha/beta hydrolase [Chloroflexi bacterium]|jgi:acetyl esterase/lipase|nr:alpha/beta hydrolase [Chloroflexota bacterium]MBT5628457.1 alpha/beta hydrolase [Chloroflexota bacterium]
MQTRTYKTTATIDLNLDVYGAEPNSETLKPVIVWIHGGALIMGSRDRILETHLDGYTDAGFVVVSIDYRLAPETKLPAILEDVEDAIEWVRTTGSVEFNLDPARLAVIGHSAGGYLTLTTGHRISPAPKALISYYGYGNLVGDWYSQPDPFYRNEFDLFTEEQAHAAVGNGDQEVTDGSQDGRRRDFYLWCRQNGYWAEKVGGYNPISEAEWFSPYSPEENAGENFPPTLLLHGNNDTDVPYEQSVLMASKLKAAGVEHDFITIENGPHGFDHNPESAETPEVTAAFEKAIEFLVSQV